MSNRDIDLRGKIVKELDNDDAIIFENEDGIKAKLPREEIAIIYEVVGVTISLPFGLAKAKGLA